MTFCSSAIVWTAPKHQKVLTIKCVSVCVCWCNWQGALCSLSSKRPTPVRKWWMHVQQTMPLLHKAIHKQTHVHKQTHAHTGVRWARCNSEDDGWAAHCNGPGLPPWWGSLQNSGQSLITLPLCVCISLRQPSTWTCCLSLLPNVDVHKTVYLWSLRSQLYMIKVRTSLHQGAEMSSWL